MLRHGPTFECGMPACDEPLRALVLSGTLKPVPEASNTEELAGRVLHHLKRHGVVESEVVRLAEHDIKPGLEADMGAGDGWPRIAAKVRAADIVLFATPIWWGVGSSLIQRCVERMDSLEEEYRQSGVSPLYNKVAGVVITGSEDGAQHTNGNLLNVLQFMGFTIPPEACCYWVGTVGDPPGDDARKRRESAAAETMAVRAARNLAFYARLLKSHPLVLEPGRADGFSPSGD